MQKSEPTSYNVNFERVLSSPNMCAILKMAVMKLQARTNYLKEKEAA